MPPPSESNVVTKHARVAARLHVMLLVGLVIVGLAGVLLVAAGALLLLAPGGSAGGLISPGIVLAVVASLLVMLGAGTILAAVAGLVFLQRFGVRGLLAAVTICAVLSAAWVAVLRPWLGASWRVAEGELQFVFQPPVQPATRVIVGEVTIVVPIWLLAAVAIVPLAALGAIFQWPERSRR